MEKPLTQALDQVISVTALNHMTRALIENAIPLLWVSGEVSNLARPSSGHLYFALKDAQAQVRCVMFRHRAQLLPFRLEEGQQVELRALPGFYEARGEFQLTVETARKAGVGALFEQLQRLRVRLAAEGLLAEERKRSLPAYPRSVGVVTSLQAAALQDVRAALRRRAPSLEVIVFPTPVQGDGAAAGVASAIAAAGRKGLCDVLIVCRGGGSIEDLWSFNDEAVARAIAASPVPVVTGIGHETDVTLADLAADVRAATPTAAAELVTAGYVALHRWLGITAKALQRAMNRTLQERMQAVDTLARLLVHPSQRLTHARQRVEALGDALYRRLYRALGARDLALGRLEIRLRARAPNLDAAGAQLNVLGERLLASAGRLLESRALRLQALAGALSHLHPEGVLARGYAIVRNPRGAVLTDVAQVAAGDRLRISLAKGQLDAEVLDLLPNSPSAPP